MKIKTELVNDDWERLYIDDKLILEGHQLSAIEVLWVLCEQYKLFTYRQISVKEDD